MTEAQGELPTFWRMQDRAYMDQPMLVAVKALKATPCGFWVAPAPGDESRFARKLVILGAARAYAYPTREQALANYIIRKEWHLRHLLAKQRTVEDRLKAAQHAKEQGSIGALHHHEYLKPHPGYVPPPEY